MPTLAGVVTLIGKTDGRDLLMKTGQNTAMLAACTDLVSEKDKIKGLGWVILDARALLWMGRWVVHIQRLKLLLASGITTVFDKLAVVQLSAFGVFFLLDNIRWLAKHNVLPPQDSPEKTRRRARLIQILGYVAAFLAELLRVLRSEPTASAALLFKASCDIFAAIIPLTMPGATYQGPLCGLASSVIGVRAMYSSGVQK